MRYLPLNESEKKDMLQKIGVDSINDLFNCIPDEVKLKGDLKIPSAKSEMEIEKEFSSLCKNNSGARMLSFMGGGAYKHYSPAAIDQMLLRSEFYTAYTPYPFSEQQVHQQIHEDMSLLFPHSEDEPIQQ